jgi:RNA polymerase sigma factor for flagellar operon FliA
MTIEATEMRRPGTRGLSPEAARLVEEHLHLIPALTRSTAAHYPQHADREELRQAAALGLVEAALRFDPVRGVPFDRWAVTRVRGAIIDAARAIDRAPRSVRAISRRIDAVSDELAQRLGRTPTSKELATEAKMSIAELDEHRARRNAGVVLSLEAPVNDEAGSAVGLADVLTDPDAPTPESAVDAEAVLGSLREAVRLLPPRLHTVIYGYFVAGRSSIELAEELGVTEARIAQIRAEGLAMMRHALAGPLGRTPGSDSVGRRAARTRDQYAQSVLAAIPRQRQVAC